MSCACPQDTLLKTLGDREAKKKMSPTNAKALNTMRQRLKKHNVQYVEEIQKYKDNPESTEEEVSSSSDSDSGSDSDSEVEAGERLRIWSRVSGGLQIGRLSIGQHSTAQHGAARHSAA